MSQRQASAMKVYASDIETVARDANLSSRLAAQDGLTAAQAVLSPREAAVLKLVVVLGRSIVDVAVATGTPVPIMEDLLLSGSAKLADHYESRAGSPF
jgi:DNA-directed RNA polymerase specialized sigma24 family protein